MAENIKTIAENRQARHEYFILESIVHTSRGSKP